MAIYADKKNGRPTGSWVVEVQIGGKRHRRRYPTFDAAKQAEKDYKEGPSLNALGRSLEAADPARYQGSPRTLSAALESLEPVLWAGRKGRDGYLARLRAMIRWNGNPVLTEIGQAWGDKLVETLLSRAGPAGVNRNLTAMSTLLAEVRKRGWCREVPHFDALEEDEGRIRVLSPGEEATLLEGLKLRGFPLVASIAALAIDTGLRRGEILALDRQALRQAADGSWWVDLDKTKSGSPRSVPLTPRALAATRELLMAGFPPKHTIRWAWDRVKVDMGLDADPDFTLHACRHTCATRLLERGFNTRVIQKWLGHKRIETTERYAHVFDTTLLEAAKALS